MSLFSEVTEQIDQTNLNFGQPFWVDQQVYDAINLALEEIWTEVKWTYTTATLTFTAGQDLTALPSTSVMIPQYIITTDNVKMFPTTHPMLQDWAANWKNEPQAQPRWIVLWDEKHLRAWPTPDQTYTFTLYGVPWPTEITAISADPPMDPLIHHAVVHRAVAFLLEHTQPQLADANMQEALDNEKRYQRQVRNQQGDNTLRIRPTVAWTQAQFGDIRTGRKFR